MSKIVVALQCLGHFLMAGKLLSSVRGEGSTRSLSGRNSSIVAVATSSAVLFPTFLIRLNLLFLSTMVTTGHLLYIPLREFISSTKTGKLRSFPLAGSLNC